MYAFVITSAAISVNGIPVSLCVGDAWDASDPVVKSHPQFFSDAPADVKRSVAEREDKPARRTAAKKG